jgi:hypothetical protein
MSKQAMMIGASLVFSTACGVGRGPQASMSLDGDRRALCRAAFSEAVEEHGDRLPEPIYVDADPSCRDIVEEIEVAMVDAYLFAEPWRHAPDAGWPHRCPGEHCGPADGGVLLQVRGLRFLSSGGGCGDERGARPRGAGASSDDGTVDICDVAPESCPPRLRDFGGLDVDTSCGPLSEGKCADVTVTRKHGFGGGASSLRFQCSEGRWRALPLEVYAVF